MKRYESLSLIIFYLSSNTSKVNTNSELFNIFYLGSCDKMLDIQNVVHIATGVILRSTWSSTHEW